MSLPARFRLRPARDEDAPAVAAFANDEAEALIGTPVISARWLLRRWTSPGVDRERDLAVIEADGTLCGYLSVEAEPPYTAVFALGMVAPPFHGLGIGAAIVAETERRARRFLELAESRRRVVIHAGAFAEEPRVSSLLERHGYREVRRFQLMRIDFAGEPPPAAPIPGIELRTLREGQERAVFDAHRDAFTDHWGEGEETLEGFRHATFADAGFDPALWFLAWDGDCLAGYVGGGRESEEDASRGYVHLLGVRRAYRRRGIGEALLRAAFRTFYARGKRGCDLHVDRDSPTGATRLYERVGMRAHPRFATWEKELRPGVTTGVGNP
jgi:mycothiol synthase